jgi:hypothetical protein
MLMFRKKPVVIEAVQYLSPDIDYLLKFCPTLEPTEHWGGACGEPNCIGNWNLYIPTLEGKMICSPQDWIIKGVNGEFYPCKPDIFCKLYDEVAI